MKMKVSVAQLYLTLCDPMDCSPPGSSVHGVPKSWIQLSDFHFHSLIPEALLLVYQPSFLGEEHKNSGNKNAVNPRPPPPRLINTLFRERRGMFKTYSHSEAECECLYIYEMALW